MTGLSGTYYVMRRSVLRSTHLLSAIHMLLLRRENFETYQYETYVELKISKLLRNYLGEYRKTTTVRNARANLVL